MTIVGTRPEIIRLSRVIARANQEGNHVLVHTGQNFDRELNEIFFEELQIQTPTYYMGIATDSLGKSLGDLFAKTETIISAERPDAVLILGDTNSCLASIMAKRMRIPVYHMEAGNRCFDNNVPEEINRRIVDHTSDFNLAYTEHARRNLLNEGLNPRQIIVTGSPMNEVLSHYAGNIQESNVLDRLDLPPDGFFVVSAHREENVDDRDRLHSLINTLNVVADNYGMPIVMSTHPRTRKQILERSFRLHPNVVMHPPFGYFDYNKLQMNAYCVLSDSGTISEESSILGFPAVTMRDSIERPEALDTGSIIMSGVEPDPVLRGIKICRKGPRASKPEAYGISDVSNRVYNFINSTVHQYRNWLGLR